MPTVLVEGCGWIDMVVVLDGSTTTSVGHYAGMHCTAHHGLAAVDMAVRRQFAHGVPGQARSLMRDTGCQPTSTAFMQACGTLGIPQALTSDHHPKGKAETERTMRTRKEECLWLQEWTCPFDLITALEAWIADYNEHSWHSALGDKPPRQFERE